MKKDKKISLQDWLPFEKILDYGIVCLKDNSFAKIIKVVPINYNLKSDLEKEAILNSYKTFFKTCNFDFQILIQSNKEDLSKHILKIQEYVRKENNLNILKISEKYFDYITKLNNHKKSTCKNFYIVIKTKLNYNVKENINEVIKSELNEMFFKIKECLSRCGNIIYEIENKEELKKILYSFFNTRKNFMM